MPKRPRSESPCIVMIDDGDIVKKWKSGDTEVIISALKRLHIARRKLTKLGYEECERCFRYAVNTSTITGPYYVGEATIQECLSCHDRVCTKCMSSSEDDCKKCETEDDTDNSDLSDEHTSSGDDD